MINSELKSKVMTLGNQLAPRVGGDRKTAFIQAWAIVKAGGLELAVRGVTVGSRQEAFRRLAAYTLYPDPGSSGPEREARDSAGGVRPVRQGA